MEIRAIGALLRRGWLMILMGTVIGGSGGIGLTLWTAPVYNATAQLYVSVQATPSTTDLLQGAYFARQQVASYVALAQTPLVLDPVVTNLGLQETSDQLAGRIAVSNPVDTSLVTITASASQAEDAAALANAAVDSLGTSIQTLETPAVGGTSTVKASVVRRAVAPSAPASPNPKYNVAVGLLVGLTFGVVGAVLRDMLETRIRTAEDLQRITRRAVIASVDSGPAESPGAPLFLAAPTSRRAEDYRRLRTNLQFLRAGDPRARVVVVTSAQGGEGKTTTAVNLALALAEVGASVALVDADLRRPDVATLLGLTGEAGLSTVLAGRADLGDVVVPWGQNGLVVLPAGAVPPNPVELLSLPALSQTIARLAASVEWVIVDCPPVGPVTDAAIVTAAADAVVVFVVRNDLSKRGTVAAGLGALDVVQAPVLGLVANCVRAARDTRYGYQPHDRPPTPGVLSAPPPVTVATGPTHGRRQRSSRGLA